MNKQIFLSLALFALLSSTVSAQNYLTQVKPAGGNHTWGYADSKGELVIPAQYSTCYKFSSEGLAPVYDYKTKQYYFINTKGQTLTTEISGFKLMDAFGANISGFNSGLVAVRIGQKWGYMNALGKLAIQAKYDQVRSFNEGYATATTGSKHLYWM